MATAAVADDAKTIIIDNYYYTITLPKRIYRVLILLSCPEVRPNGGSYKIGFSF